MSKTSYICNCDVIHEDIVNLSLIHIFCTGSQRVLGRGTDTVRPWCENIKITDQ